MTYHDDLMQRIWLAPIGAAHVLHEVADLHDGLVREEILRDERVLSAAEVPL